MDLTGSNLGAYKVLSKLGEGGMAVVWKAHDPARGERVAVKVLSARALEADAALRRFDREIQVIQRLRHPHILPLYDHGEYRGHPYFVMPLVAGGTVEDRMRGEPLAPEQAARWVAQIADALDYAHARGIVHRDLKPANVLLDGDGRALLSDFGIAKVRSAETQLTSTGAVFGTPLYMSPEQVMGKHDLGPLSDVYSLGVMAYQMVTGDVPFTADTPIAIGLKHLNEPLPPATTRNPAVPVAVQSVLERALAKQPEARFAGAGDFADSFVEAVGVSSQALVAREPARSPSPPPVRRGGPSTRTAAVIDVSPRRRREIPPLALYGLASAAAASALILPLVLVVRADEAPALPTAAPAITASVTAAPPTTAAPVISPVSYVLPEPRPVTAPELEAKAPPVEQAPPPAPAEPSAEDMSARWLEESRRSEEAGDLPRAHHQATLAVQADPDNREAEARAEELMSRIHAQHVGDPSRRPPPPGGSSGGRRGPPPPPPRR